MAAKEKVKEAAPEVPAPEISPAAMEAIDLDLPAAFLDWGIAEDIANSILQYRKLEAYVRAARHTGDPKAEQFSRDLALTRASIADMQYRHPGAVHLAKLWAAARAMEHAAKFKDA